MSNVVCEKCGSEIEGGVYALKNPDENLNYSMLCEDCFNTVLGLMVEIEENDE